MDIIVCIKQVPGTTKVDIDEKTGVLKRDGVDSKLNPYDLYAIEIALLLKEKHGGHITALTMGPPQAETIIREAYAMGVDKGVLLTDKALAGADVLATSHAISSCIKLLGKYDIIICGKQTTDGDTAQVGPETAEFLNIPHAANVISVLDVTDIMRVEVDMADYTQTLDVPLPCLITVDRNVCVPRLPSYKKGLESKNRAITIVTLNDLEDKNPSNYGLDGSATQVEKIFSPESTVQKYIVDGNVDEMAEFLHKKLKELKFV